VDSGKTTGVRARTQAAPPVNSPRWLRPIRGRVHRLPAGPLVWKIVIGVLGAAVVAVGLLLVPLPGPGWAIVFLGLAVWATEFRWAQRLLGRAREILRRWTDWAKAQPMSVRVLLGAVGLLALVGLAYVGWQVLR
jgi:uncharacterized protein (TIGR02611 family)